MSSSALYTIMFPEILQRIEKGHHFFPSVAQWLFRNNILTIVVSENKAKHKVFFFNSSSVFLIRLAEHIWKWPRQDSRILSCPTEAVFITVAERMQNSLTYSFLPQFQKEVKFVSALHGSQQSCFRH